MKTLYRWRVEAPELPGRPVCYVDAETEKEARQSGSGKLGTLPGTETLRETPIGKVGRRKETEEGSE